MAKDCRWDLEVGDDSGPSGVIVVPKGRQRRPMRVGAEVGGTQPPEASEGTSPAHALRTTGLLFSPKPSTSCRLRGTLRHDTDLLSCPHRPKARHQGCHAPSPTVPCPLKFQGFLPAPGRDSIRFQTSEAYGVPVPLIQPGREGRLLMWTTQP